MYVYTGMTNSVGAHDCGACGVCGVYSACGVCGAYGSCSACGVCGAFMHVHLFNAFSDET